MYKPLDVLSRVSFPIALACFVAPLSAGEHNPLLSFDFDTAAGAFESTANFAVTGLDVGAWSDNQGSLTDFTGNPGRAIAARGFDTGNALTLEIGSAPGTLMEIESFSFDHLASSSGPTNWSLKFNDVQLSSGVTATSFSSESVTFAAPLLVSNVLIEIVGEGASSSAGTFRLDNVALTGSLHSVPLPPAALLLLSGLTFLLRRR